MKTKIACGVLALTCVLAGLSGYTVETGEVAVLSQFGKVYGTAEEGMHFGLPLIQTYTKLIVRNTNYDFNQMSVSTKDMQSILLDLKIQLTIKDAENVYKAFKTRYEEDLIRPRVNEIVQASISKYTIEEFISKRQELSTLVFKELQDEFIKYGFEVTNVSIVNHDFSLEYEKAVEAKKIAEQKVETAQFEQEKLKVEAEKRIELEQLEQEKRIVEAENKIKLATYEYQERELRAKANKIEAESLSPNLLKKIEIEKWDGKLPQVVGNGTLPVINMK
jgi:regulator of protease activity HflC (stomatin/prohibitin superfamily)